MNTRIGLGLASLLVASAALYRFVGWHAVWILVGVTGIGVLISVLWRNTLKPVLSGVADMATNIGPAIFIGSKASLAFLMPVSAILAALVGLSMTKPDILGQPFEWILTWDYLWVAVAAFLIFAYGLMCLILMRFKLYTTIQDRSVLTDDNFFNYLPNGALLPLFLFVCAVVLSVSLYERVDRVLQNRIVDNTLDVRQLSIGNSRANIEKRLATLLDLLAPYMSNLADKDPVKAILDGDSFTIADSWKTVIVTGRYKSAVKTTGENSAIVYEVNLPDSTKVQLSNEQYDAVASTRNDVQAQIEDISSLLLDAEMTRARLPDSIKRWWDKTHSEKADEVDSIGFAGIDGLSFETLILGDGSQDEWRIDYSKHLVGPRENLWKIVATEYQFPKSFNVSDRVARAIDAEVGTSTKGRQERLFLVASMIADPENGEFQPTLWKFSTKSTKELLGAGQFQDLINANLLDKVRAYRREDGDAIEMTRGQFLFGLDPPTLRGLIRGPIQLVTLVLCAWGVLYLLVCRIPQSCWQFGYMPMRESMLLDTPGSTRWIDFWSRPTIDPNPPPETDPLMDNLYTEAAASDDLVPQMVGAVLLAKSAGKQDPELQAAGRETIQRWRQEKEKENRLLDLLIFALPNVGFLGTIIGLTRGLAMAYAIGIPSDDPFHKSSIIANMSTQLGTAFYTTLIALLCLIPLAFFTYWLQRSQDFIAKKAEVTLEHLVNRLGTTSYQSGDS